jgi:hypothetical protein
MKRFGKYEDDFANLFECYAQVNKSIVVERDLPSISRGVNIPTTSKSPSFSGLKFIKIFLQRTGQGADLIHLAKLKSIDSDDGEGSTIITGVEDDDTIQIVVSKKNAQVKVVDSEGNIENDFVTGIAPRFDSESGELTIIHVNEV